MANKGEKPKRQVSSLADVSRAIEAGHNQAEYCLACGMPMGRTIRDVLRHAREDHKARMSDGTLQVTLIPTGSRSHMIAGNPYLIWTSDGE